VRDLKGVDGISTDATADKKETKFSFVCLSPLFEGFSLKSL
jgi:hypothetical protein